MSVVAFGMLSSLGASIMTYPIETVRCRFIMQIGQDNPRYTSAIDCIQKIWKHEGISGFYNGFMVGLLYIPIKSFPIGLNYLL